MKTVASADGTLIAYEQGGKGRHLVLVHGTTGNRASFASIRPRFEQHFAVTTMDRRGCGDSGDSPKYAIEREFDDIATVVNAIGAPVLLFGHSYGALCALGAAMQTDKLSGLVLYEPWISEGERLYSPEQLERLDTLLASGDREGVVKTFFGEIMGKSPDEIALRATLPTWPGRIAAAHTIPRECRAEETYRLPADHIAELTIPVLLLLGGESSPFAGKVNAMLEEALPHSRTVVMPGQQHGAMNTGPDLVVSAVLNFWRDIA